MANDKSIKINLILPYENPALITLKTKKVTPADSSVQTKGFIDATSDALGISKNAFLSYCLYCFIQMKELDILQYIYPYYKHFCKIYNKRRITNLEPQEADDLKLKTYTVEFRESLLIEYSKKCNKLMDAAAKYQRAFSEDDLCNGKRINEDPCYKIDRNQKIMLIAILTFMYEFDYFHIDLATDRATKYMPKASTASLIPVLSQKGVHPKSIDRLLKNNGETSCLIEDKENFKLFTTRIYMKS